MKYIKTYEQTKKKYKKGDYVLIRNSVPGSSGQSAFKLPYGKIIKRHPGKAKDNFIDTYSVEILFPNIEHWSYQPNEVNWSNLPQYSIIYKLSNKEVEEIKIKLDTNKYNL